MKTIGIFTEIFSERTTGRRACYQINRLTLDAVKIVLSRTLIKFGTEGAYEDEKNGYLRRFNVQFHGSNSGFYPTAKGYRAILEALEALK